MPHVTSKAYFKYVCPFFPLISKSGLCRNSRTYPCCVAVALFWISLVSYRITFALSYSAVRVPFRNCLDAGRIWAVLHVKSLLA